MIALWVQFFRNFFCVLKSIASISGAGLPIYLVILNNRIHQTDYGLISTKTTVVEYIIATLQFLGIVFNFVNGVKGLRHGYYSYLKNKKYLYLLNRLSLENKYKSCYFTIVGNQLNSDINSSIHEITGGFFQLVIATGFFFLTCNSLHIVGPNHPKPVIDALIGQEIALLYFLGRMTKGYFKCISNYTEYHEVASLMDNLNKNYEGISDSNLLRFLFGYGFGTERLFEALASIKPNYSVLSEYIHHDENLVEIDHQMTNLLIKELQATESLVAYITKATDERAKEFRGNCMLSLKIKSVDSLANSSLEFMYLILNFMAGYGYMMGILAYYFPISNGATLPLWLQVLFLGLSPARADWWGNLVGDVAWTIEPIIMLGVSYFENTSTYEFSTQENESEVFERISVVEVPVTIKKTVAKAPREKMTKVVNETELAIPPLESDSDITCKATVTKTPRKRSETPSKKRSATPKRGGSAADNATGTEGNEKENLGNLTATRRTRIKKKSE